MLSVNELRNLLSEDSKNWNDETVINFYTLLYDFWESIYDGFEKEIK